MNEKILVVDDEKEIADLIEVYLQNENSTLVRKLFPVSRVRILIWQYWILCFRISAAFPSAR